MPNDDKVSYSDLWEVISGWATSKAPKTSLNSLHLLCDALADLLGIEHRAKRK
mgnify:CR=1 FL=1